MRKLYTSRQGPVVGCCGNGTSSVVVGQKMENFLTSHVKKRKSEIKRLIVTYTEKLSNKGLTFLPQKSVPT